MGISHPTLAQWRQKITIKKIYHLKIDIVHTFRLSLSLFIFSFVHYWQTLKKITPQQGICHKILQTLQKVYIVTGFPFHCQRCLTKQFGSFCPYFELMKQQSRTFCFKIWIVDRKQEFLTSTRTNSPALSGFMNF